MNYRVTLTVDGVDYGVFDSLTPPGSAAPEARHRPGGMGPEKTYRTLPSYGTSTLGRVHEPARDQEVIRALRNSSGKSTAVITEQPLDGDGNVYGKPFVYTGRVGDVKVDNVDSNSESVRMFSVDVFITAVA